MKKRIIGILLAVLLVSLCASCAPNEPVDEAADTQSISAQTEAAQTAAAEAVSAQTDALLTTDETQAPAQTTEVFTDATVSVREADNMFDGTNADFFTAETGEMQTRIVFSTDAAVRDFKVLALSFDEISEDGNIRFSKKELYSQARLTPDRPLVVTTVFYGDIPNNGVSYVDKDGVTRTFAVDMSGEDGSLYLSEID